MSLERSMPINPGEDTPPVTQPTSKGAYRPPPPFSPFEDGNIPSHTQGRYWSLLNDPKLTPPPPNPTTPVVTLEAFQGLTNQSDQAPLGDTTKQPEPAPSASAHNFPDPDTLSSDSTGSLREQLCLVNHRLDDVQRTLRMKDEHAEGPLRASPFVQKIQDAHIPSHFHLPMLEAYDGSFDPSEHVAATRPKPTAAFLLGMRQKEEEHLGQYLARFTDEYVTAKTLVAEKRNDQKCPQGEPSRGSPSGLPKRRMERGEQTVPWPPNVPLNSTRTEIFLQIQENGLLKTPNPLRSRVEDRDHRCYYHFHQDYGHDTEECYDLKNQIDDLIHRGHLDRYIRKPHDPSLHPKGPVEWHIDIIMVARSRVVFRRGLDLDPEAEVQKRTRPRPRGDPGFTFESESEYPDHNDALVVTTCIANPCVRRIMINTGSSADILYLDAFHKLGMTNRGLAPMTSTLTGFTGDVITPVGVATLPMTFGDEPRTKTLMVHFMVVDLPSVYNVIIRRPTATDMESPEGRLKTLDLWVESSTDRDLKWEEAEDIRLARETIGG
ncbi:hypothetical protein BHM03_00024573 [Ensete ventricosum]|uniref:Retrotransposon gag domain-containing protein n=1 Tax=Ensete ventricosum TaxID=4639 RepID=A0A445MGX9_ENSVE|nr:hypothetical protein BHM03_00024573 [Ensete ventricosum]